MRAALLAAVQLVLMTASPSVRADDASDRLKLAQQVMVVANVAADLRNIMPMISAQMRPLMLHGGLIDPANIDAFTKLFNARVGGAADLFAVRLAQIYATEFSAEDLVNLLSFYKTQTGQHLLAKQTIVAQASMLVSKQLGEDIAKQVVEDMTRDKQAKPSKM